MKKLTYIVLLLLPLLCLQCKSSKRSAQASSQRTGVEFVQSATLSDVLDKAAAENKLVFVDFYATWCQPCKMMQKDVYPDQTISSFFNKNFISYKIDGEKGNGRNLAALYNVKAYPTLVWLDAKGRVVERKEGAAYHTELMRLAKSALEKNKLM
ncbi:MAG: thioredoxin domain-containing protein [Bacteroidota bacterium]